MKRKFSLLVAAVMMLSVLPAMSVSAATKNTIVVGGGTVADDYAWGDTAASAKEVPYLAVKEDSKLNVMQGSKFSVTLENAEWDFDAMANVKAVGNVNNAGFNIPQTLTNGVVYDAAAKMLSVDGSTTPVAPVPNSKATSDAKYTVTYVTSRVAEVVADGTATISEKSIMIPMTVKMKGTGPANVVIGDVGSSGVTSGTLTFAVGADGTSTVAIKDSTTTFAQSLLVPAITVTETVPGTFDFTDSSKEISFYAPSGFEWESSVALASKDRETARAYLGFGNKTVVQSSAIAYNSNPFRFAGTSNSDDEATIEFPFTQFGLGKSTSSVGAIEFTNLRLIRSGTASETPTGPVKVRVSVDGGGSTYVTVGEFAQRAVSITAEDKALPEIISGVYPQDALDDSIRALDVVIKESSLNAWNTSTDAVFTLPAGVKFRGAKVVKTEGITSNSLSSSAEVKLDAKTSGGDKSTQGLSISDTKLKITGLNRKSTTDRMEIKLRVFVSIQPGFTGDISLLTHEDNEAFSGNISAVIAKGIDPFTISTVKTDIHLGYMNLPLGAIVIKENKAAALKRSGKATYTEYSSTASMPDVQLWIGGYNSGSIGFKEKGKYEVVSGDIGIDKIDIDTDSRVIDLVIKRESSVASEIKLSGMTMDADRTIPEGKLELRIGGSVVANSYHKLSGSARDYAGFDKEYYVADPAYINVVTAAPDKDTKYTTEVAVTIGSKTIKVNGTEFQMDVAPYNEAGYVMVPTRAVCLALGISDDSVKWDPMTKVVTVLDTNRGRTSQFQQGSNYVHQNGMSIYFEGPSCQNKESRTFLPFRALGEIVLGAPVAWDQGSQTAYYNKTQASLTTSVGAATTTAPATTTPATTTKTTPAA